MTVAHTDQATILKWRLPHTVMTQPLTRRKLRLLERLLNQKYRDALADVEPAAEVYRRHLRADMETRFSEREKQLPQVSKRAVELQRKLDRQWRMFLRQQRAVGFEPYNPMYNTGTIQLPVQWQGLGRTESLNTIDRDVEDAIPRARTFLLRRLEQAVKNLHVAAVTDADVRDLLDSIPTGRVAFEMGLAAADEEGADGDD